MSEQTLDLRRSLQIVRRHKIVVAIATVLGIACGRRVHRAHPPMLTSSALVVLPTSAARTSPRRLSIAGSDPVLTGAIRQLDQPVSLQALQSRVQARSLTSNIISISAEGKTAAQAEDTANAVANSYVDYLEFAKNPGLRMCGADLPARGECHGIIAAPAPALYGVLGALAGALLGASFVLAIGRNRPAPARARRDSGCHRGSGPGIDPCRPPIRRRGLE